MRILDHKIKVICGETVLIFIIMSTLLRSAPPHHRRCYKLQGNGRWKILMYVWCLSLYSFSTASPLPTRVHRRTSLNRKRSQLGYDGVVFSFIFCNLWPPKDWQSTVFPYICCCFPSHWPLSALIAAMAVRFASECASVVQSAIINILVYNNTCLLSHMSSTQWMRMLQPFGLFETLEVSRPPDPHVHHWTCAWIIVFSFNFNFDFNPLWQGLELKRTTLAVGCCPYTHWFMAFLRTNWILIRVYLHLNYVFIHFNMCINLHRRQSRNYVMIAIFIRSGSILFSTRRNLRLLPDDFLLCVNQGFHKLYYSIFLTSCTLFFPYPTP